MWRSAYRKEAAVNVLLLISLTLLALCARSFHVRHRLAAWQCLWRIRSGPFTVELRRHAELARLGGDSLEFPQPREFRILSLRLSGLPVWSQQAIVSLPGTVDARIGDVTAREFDHLFERQFQLNWANRPIRLTARTH
jgi:hypothetical protein